MADELLFPDPTQVFRDVLVVLLGDREQHTGTTTPGDLEQRLPFARVRRVGGPTDRTDDRPTLEVDVFGTRYDATLLLARRIVDLLTAAGRKPPSPFLDRVTCEIGPRELEWGENTTVRRIGVTFEATLRRRRTTTP